MASVDDESQQIAKLVSDILVAYLPGSGVGPSELPGLVLELRAALVADLGSTMSRVWPRAADGGSPGAEAPQPAPSGTTPTMARPAVRVEDSVHDDYLVSLEDGKHYRSLRRHLMAKYGMTPDDYRRKWGLPDDYPMVAPSYARERSEVAKRSGLGLKPGQAPDRLRSTSRR